MYWFVTILKLLPTNISGHALHSDFLLPVHSRPCDDYIPLTGEKLTNLKEMIDKIKLLDMDNIFQWLGLTCY